MPCQQGTGMRRPVALLTGFASKVYTIVDPSIDYWKDTIEVKKGTQMT
jgi:hypothetical protein